MAAAIEFSSVKYCFLFAVLLSLCLNNLSTFGFVKGATSPSKEQEDEDLEIERQLKTLNKPPIKTINTEWGDILDCIDINKQPALDHPLLKDHKIQMKPSFSFKGGEKSSSTQSDDQPSIFKRPGEGCPKGTVPIRRTHKEDLVRAKSLSANISFGASKMKLAGQNLAGLRYNISGETFYGAAAQINVYNPQLSSEDQFSSAEIAVENGPDDQINGIRVGWMVNPQLYGNHNTRLFTLWTADSYQKTGCYDTHCPGFIQIDSRLTPGTQVSKTSVVGGEQIIANVKLYQDQNTGDWWLVVSDNIKVGYWPKNLFGSLSGGCDRIYWGGHVKASTSGLSPEMGSGHVPYKHNYGKACYYKNLKVSDGTRTFLNPKEDYARQVSECSRYYGVHYYGFQKGGAGHTFLFGGRDGHCA